MHRTELYAIDSQALTQKDIWQKAFGKYKLLPISTSCHLFSEDAEVVFKCRDDSGSIINENASFRVYKDQYFVKIPTEIESQVFTEIKASDEFLLIVEGVPHAATIIFFAIKDSMSFWEEVTKGNRSIRLEGYDLPPRELTTISSEFIASHIYRILTEKDSELFSVSTQRFLNSSHILGHLFAHSTYLNEKDSIVFLEKLRIISDRLRKLLGYRIRRCERDHHGTWAKFQGERVSFCDGGVSRIVSIPGVAPTGIRVGIYTAVPGETDPDLREAWSLESAIMGSVLCDRSTIDEDDLPDEKRFQEAARYILEALVSLKHAQTNEPRVLFLHGPLQNSFETYTEMDPYYIPGVSPEVLESHGITKDDIEQTLEFIPKNGNGQVLWNSPLAVYLAIQKKLAACSTIVAGIVERGASDAVSRTILDELVTDKVITPTLRQQLLKELRRFDIQDELLFGCILQPGEYLSPVPVRKNIQRRARDRWQSTVDEFPPVYATMLKISDHSFPFRMEFARSHNQNEFDDIVALTYHTSLLLPRYAFPVGIDIVDKYAKIPDWLSKGVSAQLAATVYKRCIQTGDSRLLEQMRNVLARSPRDFFFRPSAK